MTSASALSTLADEEEAIRRVVESLEGTMEAKRERLEELGVYARYRTVFQGYVDLLSDPQAGGEALERALFLSWYDLAEPACFTGVLDLPADGRRTVLARLDSACAHGVIDDELRWTLAHYLGIVPFLFRDFGDFPRLTDFLRSVEGVTYLDAEVAPSQFDRRGLMGRYWNSLMASRDVLRGWFRSTESPRTTRGE